MKRSAILALALLLAFGLATSAYAQPQKYDFGVFADQAGTLTSTDVAGFTPFFFYVVGFDLDGLVKGYELAVTIPPEYTVLSRTLAGPAPINLGDSPDEYIVGTGGCVEGLGAFTLVSYQAGYFVAPTAPVDAVLCITGTTPSSFPGGVPGYLKCDGTLVPAGVAANGDPNYPNGCLVLNPTSEPPVATESTSFGDMKARF